MKIKSFNFKLLLLYHTMYVLPILVKNLIWYTQSTEDILKKKNVMDEMARGIEGKEKKTILIQIILKSEEFLKV